MISDNNLIFMYFIFVLGILIINTYKDYIKMMVDERLNYLAFGATIIFFYALGNSFVYFLLIVFIISPLILLLLSVKRDALSKFLGKGDIQALGWIILGLGAVHYIYVLSFIITILFFTLIYWGLVKLLKIKGSVPGLPLISGSFLVVALAILL